MKLAQTAIKYHDDTRRTPPPLRPSGGDTIDARLFAAYAECVANAWRQDDPDRAARLAAYIQANYGDAAYKALLLEAQRLYSAAVQPAPVCPRCNGEGILSVRNGDDDVPCPVCGRADDVTW